LDRPDRSDGTDRYNRPDRCHRYDRYHRSDWGNNYGANRNDRSYGISGNRTKRYSHWSDGHDWSDRCIGSDRCDCLRDRTNRQDWPDRSYRTYRRIMYSHWTNRRVYRCDRSDRANWSCRNSYWAYRCYGSDR
jgi:hypothetical protein